MDMIEQYWQSFLLLSQREKLVTLGGVLLVIWACWDNLIHQPVLIEIESFDNEISALQIQIQNQQQISKQLKQIGRNNPNEETRKELSTLLQSVDNLKRQIELGGKKFVPAKQMAAVLSDLLKQDGNLKLIKLETLPAAPLDGDTKNPAWIYRHGLNMTVQGDYFSILHYLRTLETLPWRIQWDNISYEVKSHPIAETRIQVYTVSFDKEWLGV
jgi:MSHA biogenesis protein MshJ